MSDDIHRARYMIPQVRAPVPCRAVGSNQRRPRAGDRLLRGDSRAARES